MSNKRKNILKIIIFTALMIVLLVRWNLLFMPNTSINDGRNEDTVSIHNGFQELPKDSLDYLMVGSSNVFMNIDPVSIWKQYGLTGYNMAGPTLTIYQSYYYLEEAYKKQNPKVVFLDCLGLCKYEHATDSFSHLGYDYFGMNMEKYNSLQNLPFDKKPYDRTSYYFPFMLYHSRWDSLTKSSFDLLAYNKNTDFLGYTPAYTTKSGSGSILKDDNSKVEVPELNRQYLEKIVELCKQHNTEIVLIKTPNVEWNKACADAMSDIAAKLQVPAIDFNRKMDGYSVNLKEDFCDGGAHLNDVGCRKLSLYLGGYMKENYSFNTEKNAEVVSHFDERVSVLSHFKENYEVASEKDWNTYFKKIKNANYNVCISAVVDGETKKIVKTLCDNSQSSFAEGSNYAAILNNGNIVQEDTKPNTDKASFTTNLDGHIFYLECSAKGAAVDSKLQMDYQNYSTAGKINIAVYDKVTNEMIDKSMIGIDKEGKITVTRLY